MKHLIPLALVALILLPTANAALNPDRPFEQEAQYIASFDELSNVVSGAVELQSTQAANGTVFLGTNEFGVSGLTRLYWEQDGGGVTWAEGANLGIAVAQNSSVALRHPGEYSIEFNAEHAIAFFGNAASMFAESNSENLGFGPALIGLPTDGETQVDLGVLPATPITSKSKFNDFVDESAMLLSFTPESELTLLADDGSTLAALAGEGRWVGFQGAPRMDVVEAQIVAIPTPDGTTAHFEPAAQAAAEAGLSPEHLAEAFAVLAASEGSTDAQMVQDLQSATAGLEGILNGAYLGIDATNGTGGAAALLGAATVIRFTEMSVTRDGDALAVEGSGPLQIQSGTVVGADPLIGIFPWWGLLLWAVALGGLVLRIMVKPEKSHPVWDKFGWVGWAGGIAASALVFVLWDAETKALWGSSILSAGSGGAALGVIAIVQIIPLMLAGFVIGLPLQMIIKSGTRFAGQGNFMRIGAIIAPFAVLLLGAPLMIDYLGMLIDFIQRFG